LVRASFTNWKVGGSSPSSVSNFKINIMPIYTGSSEDGSDMRELKPFLYINPYNENEWSNQPYKILSGKEKRRLRRKK
jgi:hypothetical protein